MHAGRIGSHDFSTGGGEPLLTFQVATLDHGTLDSSYGGVSSSGAIGFSSGNGQFATMAVVDGGGSAIEVTWKMFNSAGTQLMTHTFTVTV
jgi:hypothetical protein